MNILGIRNFGTNLRQLSALIPIFLLASLGNKSLATPKPESAAQQYKPAVLKLIFSVNKNNQANSFLDTILIPTIGEPTAKRSTVDLKQFARLLSTFYSQVASLRLVNTNNPSAPSRQLYNLLIGAVANEIRDSDINTLLISADSGLQAVPFAALHDGEDWFGNRYSFSLTPSLSLMSQKKGRATQEKRSVLAGASTFDGLAPLPMVEQEIGQISKIRAGNTYLNENFTRTVFDELIKKPGVDLVHLSTHAEFLPGGPEKSKLFLGKGSLSIREFSQLRLARKDSPFELFTLSACRTALGDRESELGLAGLALQAGSKTAIGSLWYVDDLATTIYFVRFYRLLNRGIPKGEAMRQVRQELSQNRLKLSGQTVIDADGEVLIENLNKMQIRKLQKGLRHPFYWAAPIMLGLPW